MQDNTVGKHPLYLVMIFFSLVIGEMSLGCDDQCIGDEAYHGNNACYQVENTIIRLSQCRKDQSDSV